MRSTAFILGAAISVVTAANDWSQPCHAGVARTVSYFFFLKLCLTALSR